MSLVTRRPRFASHQRTRYDDARVSVIVSQPSLVAPTEMSVDDDICIPPTPTPPPSPPPGASADSHELRIPPSGPPLPAIESDCLSVSIPPREEYNMLDEGEYREDSGSPPAIAKPFADWTMEEKVDHFFQQVSDTVQCHE